MVEESVKSSNDMFSGEFSKIVNMIASLSGLQKKKILKDLEGRDRSFFDDAESFAKSYRAYLDSQNIPIEYAVESYLEMCHNMLKSQVSFMRTGKYPVTEHGEAIDEVYDNEEGMKSYMIGLAISQFLWRTHFEMYDFLRNAVSHYCPTADKYLEIGPGHGLFLKEAVRYLPSSSKAVVVDISPVSIAITKSIMNYFFPGSKQLQFYQCDMLHMNLSHKYDFVTMGEVLEHVGFPDKLLLKLHDLLSHKGKAFVSTCVNAPAIDHIYHFKHVDEIREMLNKCGLDIEDELVLPVEKMPMEEIVEKKITINYCALVKRVA